MTRDTPDPRNIIEYAEIFQYRQGWRLVLCRREVTTHHTKQDAVDHLATALGAH